MKQLTGFLAQRRKAAHVLADVHGGVFDADTFVRAFSERTFTSDYQLRLHRSTLAKKAEQHELDADLRAQRRTDVVPRFGAARAGVAIAVFAALELATLSDALMALGTPRGKAYETAVITAAISVALIEGATRARQRHVRILCYIGLTILMLGVAWARSVSFFAAESSVETVVGGILGLAAAAGAGVALHHYRRRAHRVALDGRKVATLRREKRDIDRRIAAAEKAIIRDEITTRAREHEEAELRAEYARLHQIASTRAGDEDADAAPTPS